MVVGAAASLLFIQLVLSGWAESKRWLDFRNPGSQGDGSFFGVTDDFKPMANGYPGGKLFDPFGLSRGSEAQLKKYQVSSFPAAAVSAASALHVLLLAQECASILYRP